MKAWFRRTCRRVSCHNDAFLLAVGEQFRLAQIGMHSVQRALAVSVAAGKLKSYILDLVHCRHDFGGLEEYL